MRFFRGLLIYNPYLEIETKFFLIKIEFDRKCQKKNSNEKGMKESLIKDRISMRKEGGGKITSEHAYD